MKPNARLETFLALCKKKLFLQKRDPEKILTRIEKIDPEPKMKTNLKAGASVRNKVARFFLVQCTKTEENIPKYP
jgi:hypothetical protein